MRIKINGEVREIENVFEGGYLPLIELSDGSEYYVAEDSDHAGRIARKYWEEMAEMDPREFACLVGEQVLIQWGMGQYAGPGTTQVRSLEEWLDLWLDVPEEQWGSYDATESEIQRVGKLQEEIGFRPTVAYRHN